MAKMGKLDIRELKKLQKKLENIQDPDDFLETVTKKLAADLYSRLIRNTPVKTGYLKGSWAVGNIRKEGGSYVIEIINPTRYASYVEYGHRTRNHKGWVKGRFFMTMSEDELKSATPKIIENEVRKYLKEFL